MASIVSAGTTSATALNMSADTTGILQLASNNGTVAVTIDTSQNFLVGGTSNPLTAKIVATGTDNNNLIASYNTASGNAGIRIQANQAGIYLQGSGTVDPLYITNSSATGYIALRPSSNTERMRIDSSNILMGQTSASNTSFLLNCIGGGFLTTRVNIGDNGGFVDGSTMYLGADGTNSSSWNQSNANYRFGSNRGGCVVAINPSGYTYEGGSGTTTRTFAVNSNGNVQNSNNSYGSLSDAKLKENITDATPKLESLMRVKIRNFNLIADEAKTKQIGVVAQELEEIFPSMIDEHIDYTYEDYVNEHGCNDKKAVPTGAVTKEVKYSVFVPMLIKAIQELNAKVTALEEQVLNLGVK
jgi:hypothetical protein